MAILDKFCNLDANAFDKFFLNYARLHQSRRAKFDANNFFLHSIFKMIKKTARGRQAVLCLFVIAKF